MTERFKQCLRFVLKWEGGYSPPQVGDPNPTNYGIIQKVYDDWRKKRNLPPKPVKDITLNEVQQIYWERYWLPIKGDVLPVPLDLAVFDTGVNMGVGTAIKLLQRAINDCLPQDKWIKVDGLWSPTIVHHANNLPLKPLIDKFLTRRIDRYHAIAKANPAKKRFLKGWLNRVNDLKKEIGKIKGG